MGRCRSTPYLLVYMRALVVRSGMLMPCRYPQGGFVWLFYGSSQLPVDERPPIPYCPELDDPSWRPVYGEIVFDCPHWSVFENVSLP